MAICGCLQSTTDCSAPEAMESGPDPLAQATVPILGDTCNISCKMAYPSLASSDSFEMFQSLLYSLACKGNTRIYVSLYWDSGESSLGQIIV